MATQAFLSSLAQTRSEFEDIVKEIRPDLHRYCARIVGSAIDAEDVVQEALAKAFYALPTLTVSNMRGWLMRIAHNKAIDFLRRAERQSAEYAEEFPAADEPDVPFEKKEVLKLAVSAFMKLTPKQRSCVVLKDVMDYSLAEISEFLGGSVSEVKAALHRGRARLRELSAAVDDVRRETLNADDLELISRYADHFNAGNFDAIRAMLAEDVRLDLVGRAERRGAEVSQYFTRYAEVWHWRIETGIVENRFAILAFDTQRESDQPSFFILLECKEGRVSLIRDYLFAPYVIRDASVRTGGRS
ncbi:MAG TPA: sigma-70 family RNA polymerase sigma factor [Spirochaetia bacterium]|nr:sigma-70 family RNA polymerase sigma factor [Spirochaetia bacterium]